MQESSKNKGDPNSPQNRGENTKANKEIKKNVCNKSGTALTGVTDASLADNPDNRRSSCGYAWYINGGVVSFKATQQTVVALSSCEAEYMGACLAIKQGAHLKMMLAELGFPQDCVLLYTDNSANIDYSINDRISPRTAHIDTRFHFVKDKIKAREFELYYLNTESIPADALTKSLDATRHLRHAESLQNQRIQFRSSKQ